MELLVWLWASDKRLLCSCGHSPYFHVYIWLVPTILAASALVFTYMAQVMNKQDFNAQCFAYPETAQAGQDLQKVIYVQEFFMACVVLSGTAAFLQASRLFEKSPEQSQSLSKLQLRVVSLQANPKTTSYEFWSRTSSTWTFSAIIFLLVAQANYVLSLVYFGAYFEYKEAKMMVPELDGINCEVPGMTVIIAYSSLGVLPTGTFCIMVYLLALLYKIVPLVASLICPIAVSNLNRSWKGIPNRDYSHYEKEFDFEANFDEQPEYWNAMGTTKQHMELDSTMVMNADGRDSGLAVGFAQGKFRHSGDYVKEEIMFTPEGGLLMGDDENTGLLSGTNKPKSILLA